MNVATFKDRKVAQVTDLARKLARSEGADEIAFAALRREVAGELLRHTSNEVIVDAIRALKGDPALIALREVIDHCSQYFYLQDSVATAIVVPMTVRLKSEMDGLCTIWCGRKGCVEQGARMVRQLSGAQKVVFDTRLYRGYDLHQVKPGKMQDFLVALAESDSGMGIDPIAKPAEIRSSVDADWETVYFLGVAVYAPESELTLEHPAVEAKTRLWGRHMEFALDQSNPLSWQQGVEATIAAHGFWYLRRGLKEGQAVVRDGKLKSFIANFEQGVMGVDFVYTVDEAEARIRLLAGSHSMAAEHRWAVYSPDDVEAFKRTLDACIADSVPDVNSKREVDADVYEEIASRRGVIW